MRIFRPVAVVAIAAALCVATARAADADPPAPGRDAGSNEQNAIFLRSWARSLVPLVASQSLDAASSYGYRELNPLLAGPNGAFGVRATAVKFSVVGALIGMQYLLARKSPKAARLLTKVNWSSAAVTTGLAVRNYVVR